MVTTWKSNRQNDNDRGKFSRPKRYGRPSHICLILRGLPGSGKTTLCNNIEKVERKYSKNVKVFKFDEYFVTLDTTVSL